MNIRNKRAAGAALAALVCVFAFLMSFSLVFADVRNVRGGSGSGDENRSAFLDLFERFAPASTSEPEDVPPSQNVNPAGNSASSNPNGQQAANGAGGAGNNGGASSGNGGSGGNSASGGLVRSGNVISNATSVNVLNTTIVRIGR